MKTVGFVPIHTRSRAKQIYDYTGLSYGKLWPTDVDALIECGGKGYIIVELKRPNASLPMGQRLALERMIDDFISVGKRAVLILAENNVSDPNSDVIVAKCKVLKEYDGEWHEARHETVYDAVDELLFSERRKEENGMNNVVLIGRITKDLELKYTSNTQLATVKFNIAIDRPVKGERQTDYPTIILFGRQAENACKYVGKGSLVAISGRIQTGSYKNKNGDTVYTTDVVANNIEFLTFKEKSQAPRMEEQTEMPDFAAVEEDVPF